MRILFAFILMCGVAASSFASDLPNGQAAIPDIVKSKMDILDDVKKNKDAAEWTQSIELDENTIMADNGYNFLVWLPEKMLDMPSDMLDMSASISLNAIRGSVSHKILQETGKSPHDSSEEGMRREDKPRIRAKFLVHDTRIKDRVLILGKGHVAWVGKGYMDRFEPFWREWEDGEEHDEFLENMGYGKDENIDWWGWTDGE